MKDTERLKLLESVLKHVVQKWNVIAEGDFTGHTGTSVESDLDGIDTLNGLPVVLYMAPMTLGVLKTYDRFVLHFKVSNVVCQLAGLRGYYRSLPVVCSSLERPSSQQQWPPLEDYQVRALKCSLKDYETLTEKKALQGSQK